LAGIVGEAEGDVEELELEWEVEEPLVVPLVVLVLLVDVEVLLLPPVLFEPPAAPLLRERPRHCAMAK